MHNYNARSHLISEPGITTPAISRKIKQENPEIFDKTPARRVFGSSPLNSRDKLTSKSPPLESRTVLASRSPTAFATLAPPARVFAAPRRRRCLVIVNKPESEDVCMDLLDDIKE